ncbi:hypothetical protein TNIN_641 [Trichonephila inaurata madagascariensis]|uniref:C2H2-type domain-containing protein n=1 Tax=Trichonephila inaurata madagascariensis TaxID=2747483 RepID=A0A8X6Y477_9ARAC|nr:hypothetical protein TNIN_641 [Trichonephila inaurata madagascariensis]
MLVSNILKIENGVTSLTVIPHLCHLCRKAFTTKSDLTEHLITHGYQLSEEVETTPSEDSSENDSKPYPCEVCNKRFTSKGYLVKHAMLHIGEKPYSCDACDKSFSHKSNLQKHYLTHDPEKAKRYLCSECGKDFTSKAYLKKHNLIHLGQKPHVCVNSLNAKSIKLKKNELL